MEKGDFREKMLEAIDRTGISIAELSRRSGVTYDAINKLKRGSSQSTSSENTARLADVLGIQLTEQTFPSRVENGDPTPDGGRLVPVYDVTASAGQGLLAPDYEYVAYNLSFPPDYLRSITSTATGKLAIISVKGDSMSPTLNDDDIVLLDTTKTSLSYEGLFVVRIDEALQVKRLSHSRPGFVFVTSDNKDKYPVREHPKPEVEVIGKVLWSGGKVS